jgi:hypothetical protein
MIDLSRLLPKLLRANGGNPELAAKLAWSRAAGQGLRGHAVPVRLSAGTLTVAVADAIWQKQLQHMSAELLYRVNKLLGQKLVDALAFQIDPRQVVIAQPESAKSQKATPAPVPNELLFAAGSISDRDLRERFVRAAGNCISRRDAHDTEPEDSSRKPKV